MRLLKQEREAFELDFTPEERQWLMLVMNFFPLVPPAYHRLTFDPQLAAQLAEHLPTRDAFYAQREQSKQDVQVLIQKLSRLKEHNNACKARLTRDELEKFLQVVNDVRVGSWIALGSPAFDLRAAPPPDEDGMRHFMFMEMAGAFELFFIAVIRGEVPVSAAV
jgi:hypothetical protein